MTTERGGSPRRDDVPTRQIVCAVHGEVQGRVHRIGLDENGKQRYRARCPQCHTDRNTRLRRSRQGG